MKHDEEIALRVLLIEPGLTGAIAAYTDGQGEGFAQAKFDFEVSA